MNVRRIAFALGAAVTDVDLTRPLDERSIAGIRSAWLDHQVLWFPNQPLGAPELRAFSAQFGRLHDNPDVMVLHSQPVTVDERGHPGPPGDWHADLSHTAVPLTVSFMAAPAIPKRGGVTIFSNTYLAYDALSPTFRELTGRLEAIHDVTLGKSFRQQSAEVQRERKRLNPPQVHRVVLTHPDTGRKAVYLGDRVCRFEGLTEDESQPIATVLREIMRRPEFMYHHSWSADDVVVWDNRCVLHYVPEEDARLRPPMMRCSLWPDAW